MLRVDSVANDLDRTVVIAVIAMWMVQMAVDEVVDMIAVRHRFVAAARSMDVTRFMSRASVVGRAAVRIRLADLNDMFVYMVAVGMMQVAVMQIVDMIAMADRRMATTGAVLMVVVFMMREGTVRHFGTPFSVCLTGVCDGIFNKVDDVGVGDRIDDCFAFSPAFYKARLQQNLEPRRDGANLVARNLGQFADIALLLSQNDEGMKPRRISQRLEDGCCVFQLFSICLHRLRLYILI